MEFQELLLQRRPFNTTQRPPFTHFPQMNSMANTIANSGPKKHGIDDLRCRGNRKCNCAPIYPSRRPSVSQSDHITNHT